MTCFLEQYKKLHVKWQTPEAIIMSGISCHISCIALTDVQMASSGATKMAKG